MVVRILQSSSLPNLNLRQILLGSAEVSTDFLLTLADWPMASEHCQWTSDFLSYWPRLASSISTVAEK